MMPHLSHELSELILLNTLTNTPLSYCLVRVKLDYFLQHLL